MKLLTVPARRVVFDINVADPNLFLTWKKRIDYHHQGDAFIPMD